MTKDVKASLNNMNKNKLKSNITSAYMKNKVCHKSKQIFMTRVN